jgi:hypothetical protein
MTSLPSPAIVIVRRQWNDYRQGRVELGKLRNFHWRETSGGFGGRSPYPMRYARMWCDALIDGEVGHSCEHGPGPHEILVCIVKKDNDKAVIRAIDEVLDGA